MDRPTKRLRDGCLAASVLAIVVSVSPPRGFAQAKPLPKWEAPAEAKDVPNPVKTDGRTVERGGQLFQLHCVGCHGEAGIGDGKMGKILGYKPADLTLEKMSQQTDGEIFWKISKGREPMPMWEKQLTTRERWDLVSYMRTLLRSPK